jgi:putative hydrolases of HD superfamily
MSKDLANAIFEMFELNRTPRSGWQRAGLRYSMVENVAEHNCFVAQIAFVLAILEDQDPGPVVCEALFHDNAEPRTGDHNKMNGRYFDKTEGERRAFKDFIARLPSSVSSSILKHFDDFEEGKSVIAKIVKDADLLQMAFQGKYYASIGYKFADQFVTSVGKKLQTKSAKIIYEQLLNTEFYEWCL